MATIPTPKQLSEAQVIGLALKQLRQRAGLTQEKAAERYGVVVQSWRRYEWGERDLNYSQLGKLAEAMGFSREDLLAEREAVISRSGSPVTSSQGVARDRIFPAVLPVRDRVQAGAWLMADDVGQVDGRTYPAAPDPRFPYADQWLSEVVGDSVDQLRIFAGDLVHCVDAIAIGYFPKTGDVVEVERIRFQGAERELTLKEVEVTANGWLLWPRSSNPRWREPLELTAGMREVEDAEVRIRGLVLAVMRRIA